VGGNAQIKAMKRVAGTLKIDQAQYRELESFLKFSSDMDSVAARVLDKGRKNTRLLIQPPYSPIPVEEQIAVLYCGTQGLMSEVPIDRVAEFEKGLVELLRSDKSLDLLREEGLSEEITRRITAAAARMTATLKA
jgi:F-type H+-transporting ATPase subunit alpha